MCTENPFRILHLRAPVRPIVVESFMYSAKGLPLPFSCASSSTSFGNVARLGCKRPLLCLTNSIASSSCCTSSKNEEPLSAAGLLLSEWMIPEPCASALLFMAWLFSSRCNLRKLPLPVCPGFPCENGHIVCVFVGCGGGGRYSVFLVGFFFLPSKQALGFFLIIHKLLPLH